MTEIEYPYSIEDVARKFSVNPETVRRWCRDGKIAYIQLPGKRSKYRFSEQAITDFVKNIYSPVSEKVTTWQKELEKNKQMSND